MFRPIFQRLTPSLACFSGCLFFFYTISQMSAFNAISPELMHSFHLTSTELGWLSSAYLYANAIWLIPGGILLDKYSTRKITLIFMAACVFCSFVFAISNSVFIDVIFRFISGLGSAMSLLVSLRLAKQWFPTKTAQTVGLMVAFGMLGGVFADAPLSWLTLHMGWQNAMSIMGLVGVVFLIFMLFFLRTSLNDRLVTLSESKTNTSQLKFLEQIRIVAANAQNWRCGFCIGLLNLPIFLLATLWGNLYLSQTLALPLSKAASISTMIFIGEIIGSPIFGWISDKIKSRRLPITVGAFVSFIIILNIMYDQHLSISTESFLFFILGFFISAQVVAYPAIIESNEKGLSSSATGLSSFLANFIGAISQPAFGWFLSLHWDHAMYQGIPFYNLNDYRIALFILPWGFIVSLLISLTIKESYFNRQTQLRIYSG